MFFLKVNMWGGGSINSIVDLLLQYICIFDHLVLGFLYYSKASGEKNLMRQKKDLENCSWSREGLENIGKWTVSSLVKSNMKEIERLLGISSMLLKCHLNYESVDHFYVLILKLLYSGTSLVVQCLRNRLATQGTWGWFLIGQLRSHVPQSK